jgi:prolyl-tRNA synthetase
LPQYICTDSSGTDWQVPILENHIHVTAPSTITSSTCYSGEQFSTSTACTITTSKKKNSATFTYLTTASGGSFSKFSHEFQTVTDAGEDIIYIDEKAKTAVNKEILEDATGLTEKKAVEVGNIFTLGTRFSEPLELTYTDAEGNIKPVIMGCYGIGIERLMGTVAEVLSDAKGLVWPNSIAPFHVHLVALSREDGKVVEYADTLYGELTGMGIEVLYDDRDMRPGEKFADADLIGIPLRIVVSEKLYKDKNLEIKIRKTGETSILPYEQTINKIKEQAL